MRFDLPQPGMRLTRFSAGWMWGLYNLQIPFELVSIGDFLPLEPYAPMESDLLGEVIFPAQTIYLAAVFEVDEYPIFVCPMDDSGDGSLAYMMPQYEKTQGVIVAGASFDKKDGNAGVIPFSIRVETTD